jgi:enoyl-CoA hydratase/carnithine racemase
MSPPPTITVERDNGYAVLTLNRPEKRNAINVQLQMELRAALDALLDMPVIVLTGAGPAFSAGVDLAESKARIEAGTNRPTLGEMWFETLEHIRRHPAVFIAAVNGFALGGGLTLVNTCDLAIASSSASFGMPELGFGEFPGLAGATTLHRIHPKHAAYLILTAERISAAQAVTMGIVNEEIPPDGLMARATALAAQLARHDPLTLRVSKRAIRELPRLQWSEAIEKGMWMSTLSRGEGPK